jgi:hypothetical protein
MFLFGCIWDKSRVRRAGYGDWEIYISSYGFLLCFIIVCRSVEGIPVVFFFLRMKCRYNWILKVYIISWIS